MQRAASQPVHGLTNDQILQLLEENERLKEEAQYRGDDGYENGNHHLHPPSQNGGYQQNDFFYGQHIPYNSNFHQNDSSYYGNPFVPMNGQGMWQMEPPQACLPPYMHPSNPFYGRPSYPYMAQGGPNFSYQQSMTASGCGHRHDSWYHPTQYNMLERDHHQRVGGLSNQPNQIAQHQRSSTTDDHRFCEVHRSHHTHTGDDLRNSPASATGPPSSQAVMTRHSSSTVTQPSTAKQDTGGSGNGDQEGSENGDLPEDEAPSEVSKPGGSGGGGSGGGGGGGGDGGDDGSSDNGSDYTSGNRNSGFSFPVANTGNYLQQPAIAIAVNTNDVPQHKGQLTLTSLSHLLDLVEAYHIRSPHQKYFSIASCFSQTIRNSLSRQLVTTEWRWKSTYNVAREQKEFFPDKRKVFSILSYLT